MRTLAPPAGRGWEYLTGTGWDFDAEIAELPELLAEHVKAPAVEAGRYDLVIDPSNLWLTIHESIGHATELDRALGYEAAYAGTSFATLDQLGTLRYGSPVHERHRRPDRRARAGHDRLRRRGRRRRSSSTSIRDGVLVGYQLNRQMAARPTARPRPTAAPSPTRRGTSRCSGWPTSRCSPARTAAPPRS